MIGKIKFGFADGTVTAVMGDDGRWTTDVRDGDIKEFLETELNFGYAADNERYWYPSAGAWGRQAVADAAERFKATSTKVMPVPEGEPGTIY